MIVPDEYIERFCQLLSDLIEHSSAIMYGLCSDKKSRNDIRISAPQFLIDAAIKYPKPLSSIKSKQGITKFMGIKMIPSSDYALTLFHKDYTLYKEDWMIRKLPLLPEMKSAALGADEEYPIFIEPFKPGTIKNQDPSTN